MEELEDDPVVASNVRGTVTFATAGANTRTTQIFINTGDNVFLDKQGFSPIGVVLDASDDYGGMEVVDEFYAGYGEKPDQGLIRKSGIEYLDDKFPNLSFFVSAEFVEA
jgi:cyclophilin family peptidyl-prolyl cis-trans isomerase